MKKKKKPTLDKLMEIIRDNLDNGPLRESIDENLKVDVSHVGFIDDAILIVLANGEEYILKIRRAHV